MLLSRKPTQEERAKIQEMSKQFDALRAEGYRLTCVDPAGSKPSINLSAGKGPGGSEKLFSADEVKRKVRVLSKKSAQGYNVHITPVDSHREYLAVDHMSQHEAEKLQKAGYRPALVQHSDSGDYLAVCVFQKQDMTHRSAQFLGKKLISSFGDHGARGDTGLNHPLHLAGFTNHHRLHRPGADSDSPVRPLQHVHQVDEKVTAEGRALDEEMQYVPDAAALTSAPVISEYMTEQEHRAARSWYLRHNKWLGADGDRDRLNREFALHLREQGFSKRAVKEGLAFDAENIYFNRSSAQAEEYLESTVADLYPPEAEQNAGPAPKATTSAGPRPR